MYDLGLVIRNLRQKNHLTQKALANKLNISETTISKYESNIVTPPFETLRSMSEIFKVSMDEICGTEPAAVVSLYGLSDAQKEIIKKLIDSFQLCNINITKKLSTEQFAILGQIVTEFVNN